MSSVGGEVALGVVGVGSAGNAGYGVGVGMSKDERFDRLVRGWERK